MTRIAKLLSVGDLRTTGKSDEVVSQVFANPRLFNDVINAILVDSPGIRMRASDVAEKITRIHPEWLQSYKRLFLNEISKINQKEVKWHTAQMLPRFNLTKRERARVFSILLTYLEDESRIVKTFTMQALADLAMQDSSYATRVRDLLNRLIRQGSPAMRSRGKKLLLRMSKIEI